eukprot:1156504-Pelagomonas_calceolata.AAC.15
MSCEDDGPSPAQWHGPHGCALPSAFYTPPRPIFSLHLVARYQSWPLPRPHDAARMPGHGMPRASHLLPPHPHLLNAPRLSRHQSATTP